MNRVQLVQVIVVIAAVILGYQTIDNFAFFIANGISNITGAVKITNNYTINYGVLSLLYAISMFLVVNNATKISFWIISRVQPDETLQLRFSDKSVLYAVFLFLTLDTLLKNIPSLAYQVFEIVKSTIKGAPFYASYITDPFGQINYPLVINTILAFVLLIKLKTVVNYFHSKINPEDPHTIETEKEIPN